MAIDIQSLFNPGSLQQMGESEEEKKKRAQITGTMNFGGQSGTFNGNFNPSLFQQQTNTSAPTGYQPPPNYGMNAPPNQQPVPVIQPPVFTPPVGANPISGEYNIPDQQPVPLPPGNQPYVAPPVYQAPVYQAPEPVQQPVVQPPQSLFEKGPNYPGKDFGPSDLYGTPQPVPTPMAPKTIEELGAVNPEFRLIQPYDRPSPVQQPDNNQYVSIDGGRPTNPMSQIPMMENPQREYNTMPSIEMTPDFAAYQNYFNQMYNPATGSDQLPGQWAQLTPEQKAQYGATTPGPVAPGGMGLGR